MRGLYQGLLAVGLVGLTQGPVTLAQSMPQKPELLGPDREMAMALSAAPAHLRDGAAVYVLESSGFVKLRDSKNGFSCIVNRDHPLNLKPTCYDAEGTRTILPKVIQIGQWFMEGKPLADIGTLVKEGFKSGRFVPPRRPGIAYMLSGEIRNFNPQTGQVQSFPPHVMFYAPNLTDAAIGSTGGADGLPFVGYQGPHGYMIMLAPNQPAENTAASSSSPSAGAPAANYRVEVTNSMPHTMVVLYRDSAEHLLGEVKSGERLTFTIVSPSATTVTLIGREPTMGGELTQDVTLVADRAISWSL